VKKYLELIDTNTPGNRNDVTPLFADAEAFAQLIADLAEPFSALPFDFVAGIDALGFILASALAFKLHKGFIPLRKGGKLPVAVSAQEFSDYSGQKKSLELRRGIVQPGDPILLVDEWIETGAQIEASITLLEKSGGVIVGIAAINLDENPKTNLLRQKYLCHSLWVDER
jgi:adenine phosphoribosyltransferase